MAKMRLLAQAIEWYNLESIGRSPTRLDLKKLEHFNNHYISNMSNEDILTLMLRENTLTDKKGLFTSGTDRAEKKSKLSDRIIGFIKILYSSGF